jgi:sugar phosphate isomerase/epimerase
MSTRPHVHLPYARLSRELPFLLDHRLPAEVAFSGPDLDGLDPSLLGSAARQLAAAGLAVTVHAPFHDLNPGALEPLVQAATRRRLRQTLAAAGELGARLIVCHPGYEFWKYGGRDHLWLEQSLLFWPPLLVEAQRMGIVLALENIFDRRPAPLCDLLAALDSPWLGHCFDVGHWRLFSQTPLPEWFSALGPRLVHLHLHDNRGERDDHLPVGEGDIDFAALFSLIRALPTVPSMTLEAHDPQSVLRSLAAVTAYL